MPLLDFTSPQPGNMSSHPFGVSEENSSDDESFEHVDFSRQHDPFIPIRGEDPLNDYSTTIRFAFRENIERANELHIGDPQENTEIRDMLVNNILVHGHYEDAVETPDSVELIHADKNLIADLKESMTFKAIVAASSKALFLKYFPALERHFEHFNLCNEMVAGPLNRRFPVLLEHGYLRGERISDLGHVIEAIHRASLDTRNNRWRAAGEDSRVINALIRQWKGTSDTGLVLIMRLAREFQYKYRKTARLFNINLLDLLEGFPEEAMGQIEEWWAESVLDHPQWSPIRIVQDFKNNTMRYLKAQALTRAKSDTSVSESEFAKYTKILRDEGCEKEFWEIHTRSGLNSRTNNPIPEELDPRIRAMNGIPVMSICDEIYNLDNDSVLSSTKCLFVLNKDAAVTVTDNKDHIVDLEPCTNLSLTDTEGKEHRSQGKGNILVNGSKVPSYWMPTYGANVVSLKDIRTLPNHTLLDKYVFVQNLQRKTATFIGRVEDKKLFESCFVDPRNMPEGPWSEGTRFHRSYGHPNERTTRAICEQDNLPFTPEIAEAVSKCEACRTVEAEIACDDGRVQMFF